jgi:hypothetical protein
MGHKRIFALAAILVLALMAAFPTVGLLADESSTNATDVQEIASVQYELSVNSTEGGSVTAPGEGAFPYGEGTAVDLVATPDASYRFVEWTGDVATVSDVRAPSTNVTIDGNYSITANFVAVGAGDVGIKAGDWIKLTYNITGWPAGQPYAEWLKLEFLSINGTVANVRATVHISNGAEQGGSGPIDVVSGSEVPGLAGIAISANRTRGDSVYIVGHGNVAIQGETTRTYAGANRTVVYAGFSQNETQVAYYWDKLTGVMVEISSTSPSISATARAAETDMWGTATVAGKPWWPWLLGVGVAAVAAGLAIFFTRRRRVDRASVGPVEPPPQVSS